MFTDNSKFSFISSENLNEREMNTVEALSTMDNQGVSQIWFDVNSIAIDGEKFEIFYCTFEGK